MELRVDQLHSLRPGNELEFTFQVLPKNQQLTTGLYRSIFGQEDYADKDDRVREFLKLTYPRDEATARFRIMYIDPRPGCYQVEVEALTSYYNEYSFYQPGEFESWNLTWDELGMNPRVILASGCFEDEHTEVIANTVYVHPGVNLEVIPLTSSTVPQPGDILRWLYFDPSNLEAKKFEGSVQSFDSNTGRYTVLVNRTLVEIGFAIIDQKPEPLLWLNGRYNRFAQVTRPRIIRLN